MALVIFVNGATLAFMAAFMGLSALLFRATRGEFLEAGLLVGTLGLLLMISGFRPQPVLLRRHSFLITASVWMTAATAGAVPLWLWQLDAVDALFEAMSGITTTGSTVMVGLDTTPEGVLFWRALLQGLGGIGFIVTGMALLPLLNIGGMQLFRTESSDRSDKLLGSAKVIAQATLVAYLALCGLCAAAFLVCGMTRFDAVTHALVVVSTGGFANYDASFGHYTNPLVHWTASFFMVAGALPFAWYIRAVTRQVFDSEQIRAFLGGLAVAIGLLTLWLVLTSEMGIEPALRHVTFNVVSVVTTTGLASTDYTAWGTFAAAGFVMLTAIGGCTGSTSGGIKVMRWLIFLRSAIAQIRRLYSPHAVLALRYEGRAVEEEVLSGVVSFFTFYAASVFLLAVALAAVGLDFLTAVSGAMTSVGNVGPGVGPVIGPAGNFATLNDAAKLILTFGMYLGRLELLTVFVLMTPRFWQQA